MAEWIVCSNCGLKHSARPDGLCPRCRTPLSATYAPPPPGAEAQPSAYAAPAQPFAPTDGFPAGAWIAGWVLLANVLVAVIAVARNGLRSDMAGGIGSLISLAIDVLVGGLLVAGQDKVRIWAMVRVVLGAMVFVPLLWIKVGPALGLLQLAFSLGVLLLLPGRAGTARITAGLAAAGGTLVLLLGMVTNPALGARINAAAFNAFSREPFLQTADDREGRWRLTFPPEHWREAPQPAPNVDQGFVWLEKRASIMVSVKPLPAGLGRDLVQLTEAIAQSMRQNVPGFQEHERRPVVAAQGDAVAVRVSIGGKAPEEGWLVVHASRTHFGVAAGSAPAGAEPAVLEEILAVESSLDLEPKPAGAK